MLARPLTTLLQVGSVDIYHEPLVLAALFVIFACVLFCCLCQNATAARNCLAFGPGLLPSVVAGVKVSNSLLAQGRDTCRVCSEQEATCELCWH